jgi:hypothetical protein
MHVSKDSIFWELNKAQKQQLYSTLRARTDPLSPLAGAIQAVFSSLKILQNFSDFPSHQIFGHMHEALNID